MKYSVAIFTAVVSATILSCADVLHAQKVPQLCSVLDAYTPRIPIATCIHCRCMRYATGAGCYLPNWLHNDESKRQM